MTQKIGSNVAFQTHSCEIEKGKTQGSLTTFIRLINALEIDGRDIFLKTNYHSVKQIAI